MSNGAVLTDGERIPRVYVQNTVVLHIAAFTDFYVLVIGTQHGAEPHAGAPSQAYSPSKGCIRGYPIVSVIRKPDVYVIEPV